MSDGAMAEMFRRLLTKHYSLCGSELTVNATIDITDDEFDLIWDELDALDPDPTLRLP